MNTTKQNPVQKPGPKPHPLLSYAKQRVCDLQLTGKVQVGVYKIVHRDQDDKYGRYELCGPLEEGAENRPLCISDPWAWFFCHSELQIDTALQLWVGYDWRLDRTLQALDGPTGPVADPDGDVGDADGGLTAAY